MTNTRRPHCQSLDEVRALAAENHVDQGLVEAVYRRMIAGFIELERQEFQIRG